MKKNLLTTKLLLLLFGLLAGVTTNAQWITQNTGFSTVSRGIDGISIVDANTVWAKAYDGSGGGATIQEFTKTVNGGTTWTPGTITGTGIAANLGVANISAVSSTTAWVALYTAVAGSGTQGIYKTTDGGSTWNQQTTAAFTVASFPDLVHFFDANNGVCVGDPVGGEFEIYTTINGGTTWTAVAGTSIPNPSSASEYGLINVFGTTGASTLWFGTTTGRVFVSTDKGASWSVAATGMTQVLNIAIKDANNGLAADGSGALAVTTDGGVSWSTITPGGSFLTTGLAYASGTNGFYMSTGGGTTLGSSYSADDGANWTSIETGQRLYVAMKDVSTGWCGGFNTSSTAGGIFKYDCTPVISSQPGNQTISAGANASYSVAATGTALTYIWRVNDGSGFINIINGGVYSGATTPMLSITGATAGMNGYSYECIVSSGTCNVTSSSATLTITSCTATASLPLSEGFESTFPATDWTVDNMNANETWVKSANAGGNGASANAVMMDNFSPAASIAGQLDNLNTPAFSLSGATSATLTFNVAYARYSATDSDTLIVYVSTNCGSSWTKVLTKGGASLATAADVTTAVFVPASTEWRAETVDLSTYVGNAAVMVRFQNKSGWGNAMYIDDINITSASGCSNPVITSQPSAQTITEGSNTSYSVAATGTSLTYQWQVNSGSGFNNVTDGGVYSGATTATLTLTAATIGMDAYSYQCVVSSGTCNATSNSALLNVNAASGSNCDSIYYTLTTDTLSYFSVASASTWGYYPGNNSYDMSYAEKFTNTSPGGQLGDFTFSVYQADQMSSGGQITFKVYDVVGGLPGTQLTNGMLQVPYSSLVAGNYNTLTFNPPVTVSGDFFISIELPAASTPQDTLIFGLNFDRSNGARTNTSYINYFGTWYPSSSLFASLGNSSFDMSAVICPAPSCTNPVVSSQPANQTITAGSNASYTVTATGTSLTYQWQVNTGSGFNNVTNGGVYSGATTAALNLTTATIGMNGYSYQCIVSSGTCSVTSNAATLTVNAAAGVTVISLGTSGNAVGLYGNPRSYIWADPNINAVSLAHRAATAPGTGYLQYDLSTDGGSTWSSNRGPVYTPGSNGRYPQGAIYNPVSNTDPNNAYFTYYAPTLDGTNGGAGAFGGIAHGVHKLDGSLAATQATETSSGTTFHLIPNAFHVTQNGTAWAVEPSMNATTGYNETMLINKGVFNNITKTYDYTMSTVNVPTSLNSSGKREMTDTKVAFATNSTTGYFSFLAHNDYTTCKADSAWYPIVYKTTDGGTTWTGPMNVPIDAIAEIQTIAGAIPYSTAWTHDLSVDMNGNPHIIVMIAPSNNSWGSISGINHKMCDIYSADGGTNWKAHILGDAQTFSGAFVNGTAGTLNETNRPQIAATYDGKKLFFTWFDTDLSLHPSQTSNIQPDMFAMGYDVVNDKWTTLRNMTAGTPADSVVTFGSVSYYTLQPSAGTYRIPVAYQYLDPATSPQVTMKYINGLDFYDADFNVTFATTTSPSCVPFVAVTASASATPSTICSGQSTQLNTTASGGTGSFTYSWTSTPAGISSNIANPVVSPTATTSYTCFVTSGASTSQAIVSVTVNALPNVTASASPATICSGASTTLTAGGAASFSWSTGDITATSTVSPTSTATYTVTGTTSGCSDTATATVTVNNGPTVNVTASPASLCDGGSSTLIATGGASSYSWSNGSTSTFTSVNITSTQTFSVVGTGSNGCTTTTTKTVTVTTTPSAPSVIVINDTLYSSSSSGNQWYDGSGPIAGATGSMYVPTVDGSYYVIETQNGCSSPSSNVIMITSLARVSATSVFTVYPNPSNGKITIEGLVNDSKALIQVYNSAGNLVYESMVDCNNGVLKSDLKLDNISNGIYNLRVTAKSNNFNKRVVIIN